MGQILQKDQIGKLAKISSTQVSLPSSVITIGGQQYSSSAIVLNGASVGVNGLDAGALGQTQIWYVHAILSGGSLALVASLSKTAPTGYSVFAWTGWVFTTDQSGVITITSKSTTWNWQVYSPVAPSNGSIPTTLCYARFRRLGDSAEVEIYVETAGAAVATLQLAIPDGLLIDHSKVAADYAVHGNCHLNGGPIYHGAVQIFDNSHVAFIGPNGQGGNWSPSSPLTITAGMGLSAHFIVPIVGWDANEL